MVEGDLSLLVQLVFHFSDYLFNPAGRIGEVGVIGLHVRLDQKSVVQLQLRFESKGAEGRLEFACLCGDGRLPSVGNESS